MSQTTFNWIDQSYFDQEIVNVPYEQRTTFIQFFTADKGTEDLIRVYGDDFYKTYGRTLSFDKHGQALLQAKRIVDAGGELLCKRFVPSDATLSNIIVVANVTEDRVQRVDGDGNPLYIDGITGDETTEAQYEDPDDHTMKDNAKIEDVSAVVKFELQTIEDVKTVDEVLEGAQALFNDGNGVYPLFIACDTGRNKDIKRLAMVPDYETSKSLGFMIYTFREYENTTSEDSASVIMNPTIKYRKKSYAINRYSMNQLTMDTVDGVWDAYVAKLAEHSGLEVDELKNMDLLFGKTIKGLPINGVAIDEEGADLSYEYGIELKSGTTGTAYGDFPKTSPQLATDMVKFFDENDEIYDRDVHKAAIFADADYPLEVKEAIVKFVDFREDVFFLRDCGTDVFTYAAVVNKVEQFTKTKFAADYMTTYQVYDPYTDRRIRVTVVYDMLPIIVERMQSSPSAPFAGIINGFTITNAIKGTINYIPRITPRVNQKTELKDLKVNYATYFELDGPLVLDSVFTSQEKMSQLSYINNVICIQEVIRAVRTECPKNRFKFSNNDDFTEYEEAVNKVLSNFRDAFKTLKLVYNQDPLRVSQKIFYASILFQFNNWIEDEIFDLYALSSDEVVD